MHRLALIAIVLTAFELAGCERDPPDLREWRPTDHDHTQNPGPLQVSAQTSSTAGLHGIDEVTLVAWRQKCTTCHGMLGRGDGPQGAMLKAADLTRSDWQQSRSDAEIARTIRAGRGAMPAFDLPASTIDGLVRLIRLLDVSKVSRSSDAGAGNDADRTAASSAEPAGRAAPRASSDRRNGHRQIDSPPGGAR